MADHNDSSGVKSCFNQPSSTRTRSSKESEGNNQPRRYEAPSSPSKKKSFHHYGDLDPLNSKGNETHHLGRPLNHDSYAASQRQETQNCYSSSDAGPGERKAHESLKTYSFGSDVSCSGNILGEFKKMESYSKNLSEISKRTELIDMDSLDRAEFSPKKGHHVWDSSHVKLPHMQNNPTYQSKSSFSFIHQKTQSRWEAIEGALHKLTKRNVSVDDIESAIMAYNSSNKHNWVFNILYHYSQRVQTSENYLPKTIPKMAKLALDLPRLIQKPIPLLQRQKSAALTMSQKQISCLLANAFFCTFPHRNTTKPGSEFSNYPSINFSSLFGEMIKDAGKQDQKVQKLRSILHYFYAVTNDNSDQREGKPDGLVTFERISIPLKDLPDWKTKTTTLKKLYISSEGSIEKEGTGLLQVDFAHKFIGGGVLGSGLVQEEILFLMCPELIVARLFTEKLDDNECLKITGAQVYSSYSGYSKSFQWQGPYDDSTKRDDWRRRCRQIVAIDALQFHNRRDQYYKDSIKRELNKAYVGFCDKEKTAIATGNWGCGVFNGDAKLKALIQLMAASVNDRDVAYFTFGDEGLKKEVQEMHRLLVENRVTVGRLYRLLNEYSDCHSTTGLYQFIRGKITKPKSQM